MSATHTKPVYSAEQRADQLRLELDTAKAKLDAIRRVAEANWHPRYASVQAEHAVRGLVSKIVEIIDE